MISFLNRIHLEYDEGQDFARAKKLRQVRQLVLLNNLRRGDENISSTLLFSTFTRVLSDLYDDTHQTKFFPSEDADYRKTEGLNKAAQSDYREMDKPQFDYDWTWDSIFFGSGYLSTANFDRERLIMLPEVINPLVFGHDPHFSDPQRWRYYNNWVLKSRWEIMALIEQGIITGITSPDEIPSGVEAELWDYKVKRDAAKEADAGAEDSPGGLYQLLEHYTYDESGKKCVTWVDKSFSKLLRADLLDLRDGPKGTSRWPIVKREIFREPHSTSAVSLPDIVEDKHRAQNVLLNLAYIAAKDETTPTYGYDADRVKDVSQLFQRVINQHIAVSGDPSTAITPLRKNAALSQSVLNFMTIMKSEGAESVGTTQLSAPMASGRKTASEAALVQQVADLTKSLQSKIMVRSEQEFWSHWYWRHRRYMKESQKKFITLTSATGFSFESLAYDDFKTKYPPKVDISSRKEVEFKEQVERNELQTILPVISQVLPPADFRLFLKMVMFPKYQTIDSSTVDAMLPKSVDELKAEQENTLLEQDKLAEIHETDDDATHIYVHARAKNTAAKWAHYLAHEQQLASKRQEQAAAQAGTPTPPAIPGASAPESPLKPAQDQAKRENADAAIPLQPVAEGATPVPTPAIQ